MYAPQLGRFLQRDPVGYQGGTNLVSYVDCNPLNGVDPLGLYPSGLGGLGGMPGFSPGSQWNPSGAVSGSFLGSGQYNGSNFRWRSSDLQKPNLSQNVAFDHSVGDDWVEMALANGPANRVYGPSHGNTFTLKDDVHIQGTIGAISARLSKECLICQSYDAYGTNYYSLEQNFVDYINSLGEHFATSLSTGFGETRYLLGSYELNFWVEAIDCGQRSANITFLVKNSVSMESATRPIGFHRGPHKHQQPHGIPTHPLSPPPLSTPKPISQELFWSEIISF